MCDPHDPRHHGHEHSQQDRIHDHDQIRPGGLVATWDKATWARDAGIVDLTGEQMLAITIGPGVVQMADSVATGTGLVSNGRIGADLISLRAGQRFAPHTHPGDHVLIIVSGLGTLTLDGVIHATRAGQVFIVDGDLPHAVGAITDHQILAVGSPHKPVDASDRMALVEYQAVLSSAGEMHCTICRLSTSGGSATLHDVGCRHCPCTSCC